MNGYEVRRQVDPATGRAGVWIGPEPGGQLTPELLMAAAREAAGWLREMSAEEWHRARGQQIRHGLRAAWTGGDTLLPADSGRGRVTDIYLATLAAAYVEVAAKPFLKVVPTLAGMLDRPPNTIKMHVVRARDRGFLTGEPGKAGGELTAKAYEVLAQHVEDTHPYG